jgi:hypothetical protein
MTTTRCKFKVDEIRRAQTTKYTFPNGRDKAPVVTPTELRTLILTPVYRDKEGSENKAFWDASPSGKLELGCVNLPAVAHMDLGDEFYIDITPAPKG